MAADTLKEQAKSRELKVGHFIVEFATPGIGHLLKNRRLRLRPVRHRAFGLPQRDHQERHPLLRGGAAAGDRARAVEGVPSHRPRRRHGRRGHHAADGQRCEEARHILDCMKYVPDGQRGVALGVAHDATGAGRCWTSWRPPTRAPPSSPRSRPGPASRTPTRIAATDGVDCLWVGHFDLSSSLGIPGQFEHKDFLDAIDTVVKACRKHGKATGRLVPDVAHGRRLLAQGLRLHLLFGRRLGLSGRGQGRRRRHPRRLRGCRQ